MHELKGITEKDSWAEELLAPMYNELRRIAAAQVSRVGSAWTLQPTALVHEAWLRLTGGGETRWQDQSHFVATVTEAMRHVLIDRARRRHAVRHGGGLRRINVDEIEISWCVHGDEALLGLDAALEKLALKHPEIATLIKLQCFAGLEVAEAAQLLGLTRSAAYRKQMFARAWLSEELSV